MKDRITQIPFGEVEVKLVAAIESLFDALEPIEGECRAVKQCAECGHMWVHQYIPYSFGSGRASSKCMCVATSINGEHRAITIEKRTP